MTDYIQQIFERASVSPADLQADPSLIDRLVEEGMRVTKGQANRSILANELLTAARR